MPIDKENAPGGRPEASSNTDYDHTEPSHNNISPARSPPNSNESPSTTLNGAGAIEPATPEQVERFAALLVGHGNASGTHGIPTWDEDKGKWAIKSTARTLKEGATLAYYAQHLAGTRPLGIVPIRADSTCSWGCGDIDDYDLDTLALVAKIEQLRYPLIPVRSKSGGIHLFLFLREPEPAAAVQARLRDMMASLGHAGAEVFPKQVQLVHERDKGNWIVIPYFGGDFGGKLKMQAGLKRAGGEMTLGEFLRAAEAARTATAEIKVKAPRARSSVDHDAAAEQAHAAKELARWAEMVRTAPDGTADTTLNKACFAMGTMVARGWIPREDVEAALGDAARERGFKPEEIRDKLRRCIDAGMREPHADLTRGRAIRHAAPWRDIKDRFGNPAPTLANAVIGIKTLGIGCRLDLFHHMVLVDYQGDVAEIKTLVGELTDDTLGAIRSRINNQLGLDVGDANTFAAVKEIARNHAFDPVLDYLAEVQGRWDQMKRIDTWLTDYCGAPDTPFTRAVARKHLVASVCRARKPGCKYDDILVMESPEGKNKSTAIMVLAGKENFSDQTILGVEDRVAQELMTGVWLYEIADLTDIAKADVNRVKAFASRDTDRARPVYARVLEKRPRRCTLWATTNDQQYLKSQTGNRRFLPVPVGRIDIEALACDRDQLWAEAAVAEANNESIMLDESLWATATEEQEKRRTVDPWEDILANMPNEVEVRPAYGDKAPEYEQIVYRVRDEERVATADVLTHVLKVNPGHQQAGHGQRLALIMERLGWQRPKKGGVMRIGGKVSRGYWRTMQEPGEAATAMVPKGEMGHASPAHDPPPRDLLI